MIGPRTNKTIEEGRSRRGRLRRGLAAVALASGACLVATPAFAASSGAHLAAFGTPASGALDTSAIAAKVDPGVVDINTTLSNGAAAGTGMVLTSNGVVLTNNHVINGATSIKAQIAGTGPTYSATVLGYDASDDVALIKLNGASGLATISTADSSQVKVGDPVVALGNALGRGGVPAVAEGKVTAVDQTITAADDNGANPETLTGMIQVDAAIQPGDSGGPLANASGNVVGMVSAGSSSASQLGGASAATEGFAIPINHALDIAQQIENGTASPTVHIGPRAILGVEIQPTSAPSGSSGAGGGFGGSGPFGGFGGTGPFGGFGSFGGFDPFGGARSGTGSSSGTGNSSGGSVAPSGSGGVQISGVASGGPAESAGLVAGDTINALDGHAVGSPDDLSSLMNAHHPGDNVKVQWTDSSGRQHTATVTLVEGPPA